MELTVQQITPNVLSAQGSKILPLDLQSPDSQIESYCLLYSAGGSFEVSWNAKSYVIPEGCAFLFFPKQSYFTKALTENLQLIDIRFDLSGSAAFGSAAQKALRHTEEALDILSISDHSATSAPLILKPSPQSKGALDAILWELQKGLLFSREIADLYLKAVLLGVIRTAIVPQIKNNSEATAKIMHYVSEHITENLQNDVAAKALSYHPNYINRVIKKATGKTFHKYVIDEKLHYAATLLLSTGDSITEIAYSLSFNTSSHFSNLFAEKYHCTPSQYRKKNG